MQSQPLKFFSGLMTNNLFFFASPHRRHCSCRSLIEKLSSVNNGVVISGLRILAVVILNPTSTLIQ